MRVAAIDIGTNTILLLIADVEADGSISMIRDEQVIARLGKGVDANRQISGETLERARSYLSSYKEMIDAAGVQRVIAAGTSFLRDARNQKEFVEFIRNKLGIEVRILSGEEEANLTYQGSVSEFRTNEQQHFAVLDIGGGSTELTLGINEEVHQHTSIDVGSVRITERFLRVSPPSPDSLAEARQFIKNSLSVVPQPHRPTRFIGVAGTLTTLAAIDLRLKHYDRTTVTGHVLSYETINSIFEELKGKSIDEIRSYPQILAGRSDILLAGVLILLEVLRATRMDSITVSDSGLRFGLALSAQQR